MELIGIIMPLFIDAVNRYVPHPKLRLLVAFLMCAAAGVAINAERIKYSDPYEIMGSIAMVFASSQLVYQSFYKDSKVQKVLRGEGSP